MADQLAALRTQLAGTSALRAGARRRLTDDIGALEPTAARLRDAAHAAADLAAERTRAAEQHAPRSVWTTTVHRAADTDRLAAELDTARTAAAHAEASAAAAAQQRAADDEQLRRDLDAATTELDRRRHLTPTQRDAEKQIRRTESDTEPTTSLRFDDVHDLPDDPHRDTTEREV